MGETGAHPHLQQACNPAAAAALKAVRTAALAVLEKLHTLGVYRLMKGIKFLFAALIWLAPACAAQAATPVCTTASCGLIVYQALTVPSTNTLSPLSIPFTTGAIGGATMYVNGWSGTDHDNPQPFSVSGTTITWNATNAGFPLLTSYTPSISYSSQAGGGGGGGGGTTGIVIGTTLITGGANGDCLYDTAGVVGITSCGAGGGLTVGTTTISGGTSGQCLFDNAGKLSTAACSGGSGGGAINVTLTLSGTSTTFINLANSFNVVFGNYQNTTPFSATGGSGTLCTIASSLYSGQVYCAYNQVTVGQFAPENNGAYYLNAFIATGSVVQTTASTSSANASIQGENENVTVSNAGWSSMVGNESDVTVDASLSGYAAGVQITRVGTHFGVQFDAGLFILPASGPGWKDGIYIYPGAICSCGYIMEAPGFSIDSIGDVTALSVTQTSDRRLKENIVPTTRGLSTLMDIKVRDFDRIRTPEAREEGFIAQELIDIVPDFVKQGGQDPTTQPWSVDYAQMTALTVKSIQDQQSEIIAMQSRMADMQHEIDKFHSDKTRRGKR
jgi:hypothetical protein